MSVNDAPFPQPSAVPVTLMRGGTSKGVFIRYEQLPHELHERDRWILNILGSPDPMQLDGLGGTHSSTSKLVAVTSADTIADAPQDCDLAYWFAQVGVADPVVDDSGNCGNLTAAVAPYALHQAMIQRPDGQHTIRLFNINTSSVIEAQLTVANGRYVESGDFALAGVPGTGGRIDTRYLNPQGAATGQYLPSGAATDTVSTAAWGEISVSVVDAATPIIIIRGADIGVDLEAAREDLNADAELLTGLEELRLTVAVQAGLAPDPDSVARATPRIVMIADDGPGKLQVRSTSMSVIHHALPATVMLSVAAAVRIPGTIAQELFHDVNNLDVVLRHAKGEVVLSAPRESEPSWVASAATARVLLDGSFYLTGGAG